MDGVAGRGGDGVVERLARGGDGTEIVILCPGGGEAEEGEEGEE